MSAVAKAEAAWGRPLPDWIGALAAECDRTSQCQTAGRLRYSATVVSCTLNGGYKGSLAAVEERVRAVLMRTVVACPVLGEISGQECQGHQEAPFTPTNPTRVWLWHACPTCAHWRGDARGRQQ